MIFPERYGLYHRDQRGVAPADWWNWGEWELEEYKWKESFLGWFVGFLVPVQGVFFLSRLGCSGRPSTKIFFYSPYTISIYVFLSPSNHGAGSRAGPPVSECAVSGLNSPVISESWYCVATTLFTLKNWKDHLEQGHDTIGMYWTLSVNHRGCNRAGAF
jgi:hypothetical protein